MSVSKACCVTDLHFLLFTPTLFTGKQYLKNNIFQFKVKHRVDITYVYILIPNLPIFASIFITIFPLSPLFPLVYIVHSEIPFN